MGAPPQIGAPDLELNTSLIIDVEEADDIVPHGDGGCCYFNGASYLAGQYALCGHEVLPCQAAGSLVPQGGFER